MDESQQREVAEAFDATPELLPFIPELLSDLWALGCSLEVIVELLRPLGLPAETTRVLDLGCGKGAVALTLAREFGFQALGVDFFEPFIEEARRHAEEMGLASRCGFVCEDIRDTLLKANDFDVVIYASVGVLGRLDECVAKLRQCIHPGGYMLIDAVFLADPEKVESLWHEHCATHQESLRRLTAHGDALLHEVIIPTEDVKALNRKYTELIRRRAEKLAELHPEAADSFLWYVEKQERESEIMETTMISAVWLLQRP
ncbi:MAG TPA: class I SAM-dependent methyltransferase [Dehalococcoidia bacterium]|nr:class I SAM-dependent methyltransferase [Dehalococcoidia bacterium]